MAIINVVFRQLYAKILKLFFFVIVLHCCLLFNTLVVVAVCHSAWIFSRMHTMSAPVVVTLLESTD